MYRVESAVQHLAFELRIQPIRWRHPRLVQQVLLIPVFWLY